MWSCKQYHVAIRTASLLLSLILFPVSENRQKVDRFTFIRRTINREQSDSINGFGACCSLPSVWRATESLNLDIYLLATCNKSRLTH